jgi:hypothetical protein
MNALSRRLGLLGAAAILLAACNGGLAFDPGTTPVPFDLLVAPPIASTFPTQLVPNVSAADGRFDLHLDDHSFGGQVVQAVGTNFEGVQGASVSVLLKGTDVTFATVTGSGGTFALPIADGLYDVKIVPPEPLAPRVFHGVTVAGGPISKSYVVSPGLTLQGTISSPSGTILQGWRVSARKSAPDETDGDPSSSTTTNQLGFHVYLESTGSWVLTLLAPLGSTLPSVKTTLALAGSTTYHYQFPSGFPQSAINGVVGHTGPAESFVGTTVRVHGTPPGDPGDPTVSFFFDQRVTADTNGIFAMSVPAASGYAVTIEPPLTSLYSHLPLSGIDATSPIALVPPQTNLVPKVTARGRTVDPNGQTVGGVTVDLRAADDTLVEYLTRSGGDGVWSLGGIDVGSYTVTGLPAPGSGYVRGGLPKQIDNAISNLDVTVAPGFRVSGRVLDPDGNPVAGALVRALDPSSSPNGVETEIGSDFAISDADGGWTLTVPLAAP